MRFKGHYLTKRDGGLRYDYEAIWTGHNGKILWEAVVKRGDTPKGYPRGQVLIESFTSQAAVRALIEDAIEMLAGVVK